MTDLHIAEVTRTAWLTPGMVRVTFGGEGLTGFRTTGIGDEFVRVHFPASDGVLHLPRVDDDGVWHYPDGVQDHVEPYTIRRHDAATGEVDIDLVVHGHGRAGAWAAAAAPGDRVALGDPRGLYEPPSGAVDQVFVTDATGLPALARLSEQLAPDVRAVAAVEIAEESHRLDIDAPNLSVRWIVGRGNGVGPSAITEALRALPISDECYVWVAGEAGELRAARRYLRHDRGLPAARYAVIGYWRDRQEEWLERYEALNDDTLAALQAIWETDADEELRRDRYDAKLAQLGL
ncbi:MULTISPECIES: siderophore-interacting protein [unclassified Microbacterium]|uniref:siderophore-interacting protein n=1 Tax=unclassified Microbacterium TaxID=2609290 RepID=UPI003018886C